MELSAGVLAARHGGTERILACLLAAESLLYTRTRCCYRTAVGHDLKDLPELFKSQCQHLEETIHEVVERIRPLEGMVPRILPQFLEHPQFDAQGAEDADARAMITNIMAQHKAMIQSLRVDLGRATANRCDAVIGDFLKELVEEHRKAVWTLCSLMEEQSGPAGIAPS